ncbi:MAG TPA: glycosyltransferase [Ignavibacteriaceae bacterium]|nr:glycosyltransferase [Ignavibacteriaceae bacterium]
MTKKVLFVTYYWPPSGKASSHWPLQMIKYLPNSNWLPTVLTINDDSFSHKDESLSSQIDEKVEVFRTKVLEPFDLYRKFLGKEKDSPLIASETISLDNKDLKHRISIWIRMNLFVPDARIGWYPYAVKKGKEILEQNKFDAIVTIGPPHSTHLIGMKLSDKFNIPFFPVFIDPWVDIVYYKNFKRNPLTLLIDNYLEKKVIGKSSKTIFVTESMRDDYKNKYQLLSNKYEILHWGYSEDEFASIIKESVKEEKIILHAGNIFDYQNIVPFWEQVKAEISKGNKLKLKFIGTVSNLIKQSITDCGLDEHVEYMGFIPYSQVPQEMLNADYLLVCATEKRHLPGKLFEYLRTGNPIIAFGDDNTEIAAILEKSNAGMLFNYSDTGAEFFKKAYSFNTDFGYIKRFDRKYISAELGNLLNTSFNP